MGDNLKELESNKSKTSYKDEYTVDIEIRNNGGKEGSPSCFIATAVFENPYAPELMILRRFRNEFLLTNSAGTLFVRVYYWFGPYLANLIRRNAALKKTFRTILGLFVKVLKRKFFNDDSIE